MRPFALHTSKANLWAKSKRVAIACSVTSAHQAIVYISISVILGYALFFAFECYRSVALPKLVGDRQ